MTSSNKISKNYMSKIRLFFALDWIILSISIILIFYYLINYFSNDSFIFFNVPISKSLLAALGGFFYCTIKFYISLKIKARLITEIVDESTHFILTVYDKSIIIIDKPIMTSLSRQTDFFLNGLFSPTIGTILLPPKQSVKFILLSKSKKYYLVPTLFEYAIQF